MMVTLRLPKELEEKLDQLAKKEERSKAYIIRKALEEYLADYEETHNVMYFVKNNAKLYPIKKQLYCHSVNRISNEVEQ
jgi:predicted DNA-binding protein